MALLVDTLPGRTEAQEAAKAESRLLGRLKELEQESDVARDRHVPPSRVDMDLTIFRGELRPAGKRDPYFAANFVEAFVDREVAQLTDNRPTLNVAALKHGLRAFASELEKAARVYWDICSMQRQTWKMAQSAAVKGLAGIYTGYDPIADEIVLEVLDRDQLWIDPMVREAALVDRHAEYLGIERVRTLDELKLRFPGRGAEVKADASLTEDGDSAKKKSLLSPLSDMARRFAGGQDATTAGIERARVKDWYLRDRRRDAGGRALFPTYRHLITTKDVVLYDQPLGFWDGLIPVDLFDWNTDPEHPWGASEPARLEFLQRAYNRLMDGLVENQILTNFVQVVMDHDAISDRTKKMLQDIGASLLVEKKNRNAAFGIVPPQPFGADKIGLAKFIFTVGQLLTGVTDVTLGENPGSLQSGQAIEGLQEGASLMNRSRASRLEDLYARVGQKLLARIIQFVTADRLLGMTGVTPDSLQAVANRTEFFVQEDGTPMSLEERQEALRYLRFAVMPGSSRPGSRSTRAKMMLSLHQAQMASRQDVLEAAEMPDPEAMIKRADADKKAMMAAFPPPPPKK